MQSILNLPDPLFPSIPETSRITPIDHWRCRIFVGHARLLRLQAKNDALQATRNVLGSQSRMSTNRKKTGGRIRRTSERGANGRGICRWCGAEVPKRRHTFCDDCCVHEWRLRTDPGYLREKVRDRDRGICAICGLNTIEFYRRLQRLPRKRRVELRRRLDIHPGRRSFWDADHIRPVVEGGGECDLSNIRTLCLWCHRDETEKLWRRRQNTDKQRRGETQRHTKAF